MENPISTKVRGWVYLAGGIVGAVSGSVISTLVILELPIAAAIAGTVFSGVATAVGFIARSNLADASSGPTVEVVKQPKNPFEKGYN